MFELTQSSTTPLMHVSTSRPSGGLILQLDALRNSSRQVSTSVAFSQSATFLTTGAPDLSTTSLPSRVSGISGTRMIWLFGSSLALRFETIQSAIALCAHL